MHAEAHPRGRSSPQTSSPGFDTPQSSSTASMASASSQLDTTASGSLTTASPKQRCQDYLDISPALASVFGGLRLGGQDAGSGGLPTGEWHPSCAFLLF